MFDARYKELRLIPSKTAGSELLRYGFMIARKSQKKVIRQEKERKEQQKSGWITEIKHTMLLW